jgi:hypothetical protein
MHFKFLSEVGEHYATETTAHLLHGKVAPQMPLRMVALRGLAAGLLKAKTEYERLDRQQRGIHGSGVSARIRARAAMFAKGSEAASRVSAEAVATAKGQYEAALRHFQNQGRRRDERRKAGLVGVRRVQQAQPEGSTQRGHGTARIAQGGVPFFQDAGNRLRPAGVPRSPSEGHWTVSASSSLGLRD